MNANQLVDNLNKSIVDTYKALIEIEAECIKSINDKVGIIEYTPHERIEK